jgi:hypothetical protein
MTQVAAAPESKTVMAGSRGYTKSVCERVSARWTIWRASLMAVDRRAQEDEVDLAEGRNPDSVDSHR